MNTNIKFGNNTSNKKLTTAVIAAGGFGTRFLPFTKVVPKELLPLIDTPTIELLIQECVMAGIKKIYIITRSDTDTLQRYFSPNIKYENFLIKYRKLKYLPKLTSQKHKHCKLHLVKENENLLYGNARGLFTIQAQLKKENQFLLLFGDDIVISKESSIKGLIQKYFSHTCEAMITAKRIPISEIPKYGNIKVKKGTTDWVEHIIQKPTPKKVVSNLALCSQLIITPKIFKYLNYKQKHSELDLGIALDRLAQDNKVLTYKPKGVWCTIGDPVNYLKANLTKTIFAKLIAKKDVINYIKTINC